MNKMGYLSCKAESSILTTTTTTTTIKSKKSNHKKEGEEGEKPIKIQEFNYRDLEAATNGFSDQKILGRGSQGCVYKGVLRSGRIVAIKKPSSRASSMRLNSSFSSNEVDNEIDILSKIQSPRLVNLLGFSTDSKENRLLVVEFMSNGALYDVLHSSPLRTPPNWGRRIRLALQTAKAIHTLHSSNPPIIHRDIKSANVLIDRNFNARLGDFGLALRCHIDDDFRLRSTPPAGTIGYLDPGYVTPDNLSSKTDVFSFGILLLEIISGRKAIDVGHSPPSIVDWAIPLIRKGKLLAIYDPRILPPKDPSVMKQLAVLAAKCARSCRERRPSMKEVVESLSILSKTIPVNAWNGFSVNNPCMMVEAWGGRPVGSGGAFLNPNPNPNPKPSRRRPQERGVSGDIVDSNIISRSMRNSRRVYSDLGLGGRNNLMDLMVETDEESNFRGEPNGDGVEAVSLRIQGSGLRNGNGNGRPVVRDRGRTKSLAHNCYKDDGVGYHMRRNHSVGGQSYQREMNLISHYELKRPADPV